ncbi:hypothetical protein MHH93_21200 [Priestia sp. FSL H7-0729]
MKRALVIGGNGTFGKAVVAKLRDYSVEFIGFNPVPVEKAANTFIQSALGIETAQNFKIY